MLCAINCFVILPLTEKLITYNVSSGDVTGLHHMIVYFSYKKKL